MGLWWDVFCGRTNQESDGRKQSVRHRTDSTNPKLNGNVRVWTYRHGKNSENADGSLGTYHLGDGEEIGVHHNPVHCDVGFGYCEDIDGRPNYHEWHSFSPERGVPAWAIEKVVKKELNRKFMREYTNQVFHPSTELAPYFDKKGNFIGDDPNMTFQISPKVDQLSKWLLSEGGMD